MTYIFHMSKAAQWACGFLVFIQWCPNPQALNHLSVSVRSACLLAAKLAALLLVPKAGERRIPSTVLAHESAHGERGVRALQTQHIVRTRINIQIRITGGKVLHKHVSICISFCTAPPPDGKGRIRLVCVQAQITAQ